MEVLAIHYIVEYACMDGLVPRGDILYPDVFVDRLLVGLRIVVDGLIFIHGTPAGINVVEFVIRIIMDQRNMHL